MMAASALLTESALKQDLYKTCDSGCRVTRGFSAAAMSVTESCEELLAAELALSNCRSEICYVPGRQVVHGHEKLRTPAVPNSSEEQQSAQKYAAAVQRCELQLQRVQEHNSWMEAEGMLESLAHTACCVLCVKCSRK